MDGMVDQRGGSVTLDQLMNDPGPRIVRQISHDPKDGYVWNALFGIHEESDDTFRARIKAMYAAHEWQGPTHEGPTGPAI